MLSYLILVSFMILIFICIVMTSWFDSGWTAVELVTRLSDPFFRFAHRSSFEDIHHYNKRHYLCIIHNGQYAATETTTNNPNPLTNPYRSKDA